MKLFPRQALALLACACIASGAALSAEPERAAPLGRMMGGHGPQGGMRGGDMSDGHGEHGGRGEHGQPGGMMGGRGEHGEHGGPGGGQRPAFLRGVRLDEAQQDKVFAILHAQAPLMREQAKAARKAHEALRAISTAAPFDDAKASALAQVGAKAMAAMALQHARTEAQIYALFTPEQRRQATERDAHRGPHPEGGPEGRPAPRPEARPAPRQ